MLRDECCLVYTMRDQRLNEFSDRIINTEPRYLVLADHVPQARGGFGDSCVLMREENASAFRKIVDDCAGLPPALDTARSSVRKISDGNKNNQQETAWTEYARKLSQVQHFVTLGLTPLYVESRRIVDIFLNLLQEDCREEFRALCVARKEQIVPLHELRR